MYVQNKDISQEILLLQYFLLNSVIGKTIFKVLAVFDPYEDREQVQSRKKVW